MSEKSIGEKRVRADFNANGSELVDTIKQETAKLINLLDGMRNSEASKTYDKSDAAMKEMSGEKFRLISLAQTSFEEAAMWAVKAATA